MNLAVDIGNTAVKICRCSSLTLGKTYRYQGEKIMEFIREVVDEEKPEVMAVCCAYALSDSDCAELSSLCANLVLLDPSRTSIAASAGLPLSISPDRVASIIASRHLFGKNCTIVDFGTTMSIDFIGEDGEYEGGNVTVGCRTRFRSISRYSKSLPLVDTPSDAPIVCGGSDIRESISAGIISGIMFEIEGYLRLYPENVVVFTGGDANFFANRIKNSIFVICNLVLMGLALIADKYVKIEK